MDTVFNNRRNLWMSTIALFFVFFIAVLLRVNYVRKTVDDITIARDAEHYVTYGRNLAFYRTFSKQNDKFTPIPDSFRSPGYPFFIALAMKIGGESKYLKLVVYTQAFLSAALVPLTFFAGMFFLPIPAAIAAALLVAISPHLVTTTACLLTETLYSFLLLSAICVFQLALRNFTIWLAGTAAVLFGCAFLTNETTLFIPIILSLVIIWGGYFSTGQLIGKRKTYAITFFLAIYMIFPICWWLRGYYNVPTTAQKGSDRAVVTMSHGAYPGFIHKNPFYKRFPYREDPQQPVFASSLRNFSKILWSRTKNEPLRYMVWYLFGKPFYLWNWNIIQGAGDIYINPVKNSLFVESEIAGGVNRAMKFLHPLLLVSALMSVPMIYLIKKPKRIISNYLRQTPLVPLAICIYFTIIYTIFAPWPRYSIPLRPELYLCAIWTLSIIIGYLRTHKVRS